MADFYVVGSYPENRVTSL